MESAVPSVALVSSMVTLAVLISVYHRGRWRYLLVRRIVPRISVVNQTEDVLMGEIPVSRHWLALNVPRSRPEALQLVHAYGDSMLGTLNSGDFAIVDTDCQVADIDGVYVLQANGQLFIKRVTRRMDGAHVITSDNPSVRTVDVLDGSHPVRICGRVVYGWNGRRF